MKYSLKEKEWNNETKIKIVNILSIKENTWKRKRRKESKRKKVKFIKEKMEDKK
jgi:hypothetical protein